jgi:hypothetical protein
MIDDLKIAAITKLCPNGWAWNDGNIKPVSDPKPTEAEIDAQIEIERAEYDALAWKRSREENYPSIAELTVALYDTDDKSAVEAKRAEVKAKYPKPE